MTKPQITETDLHAWVDGQGSFARRAEVEHHLASHPEDANRAQAYQAQKRAVQELFNPVLDEPLPDALRELASRPASAAKHGDRDFLPRWSLQRVAASVLLTLTGGAVGWLIHGQYQPAERMALAVPLAHQAAVAHLVYSPDLRRPVEVSAEHEDQLVTWLSKRMGAPVRAPKLSAQGFELVGGRLLPGNSGPVAQFMYQDASGQRLTLMVSNEIAANHDTAFRFSREGTVNVFYWIDGKYGYALSAGIDKGALARVASAVYDQLDRN